MRNPYSLAGKALAVIFLGYALLAPMIPGKVLVASPEGDKVYQVESALDFVGNWLLCPRGCTEKIKKLFLATPGGWHSFTPAHAPVDWAKAIWEKEMVVVAAGLNGERPTVWAVNRATGAKLDLSNPAVAKLAEKLLGQAF